MQLNIFEQAPYQIHSVTSREAATSIKGRTANLRTEVLEALRRHPSTDERLSERLAMSPNTCRPRRVELVICGLVEDSGRREKTASGRSAVVWIVKEDA
jgi:predicted ArsR family transcriptional regulator